MFFAIALGVLVGAAFVVLVQQLVDDAFSPTASKSERAVLPRPAVRRPQGLERSHERPRAA
ncbi:MAG: hypothetical protein R3C39_16050 [Dehalococcoidia bacterium]